MPNLSSTRSCVDNVGFPPSALAAERALTLRFFFTGLRKQGALKMPHRKGGEDFAMVSEEREDYLPRVVHEWEFSGWGTMSYMEIAPAERDAAAAEQSREEVKSGTGSLGRWLSTGVAGVAVAGSPLYSFPPVVLVAGV